MSALVVSHVDAITPLGSTWNETWRRLCLGPPATRSRAIWLSEGSLAVPVMNVPSTTRNIEASVPLTGATGRLIRTLLERLPESCKNLPIYIGTAHGETDILLDALRASLNGEPIDGHTWRWLLFDSLASLGDKREARMSYSACTSGMHALASAAVDIDNDVVEGAIVLGVDALSIFGIAGFVRTGAMKDSPCSPFSETNGGTVISEGVGVLVVKKTEPAVDSIVMRSVAMSCDAGHATLPDPTGKYLEACWHDAIRRANITPSDVDIVIFHGSGTRANDETELAVYHRVFGDTMPLATALKGCLGHTMGASGIHNCIAAIEALRSGALPPVGDMSHVRNGNFVSGMVRDFSGKHALVSCSGFGGNNVAAIFGLEK
ncbi:MAG: hypothetical protein OMOMHJEC_03291 [Xanthomonadales bacterium]|nr:hypothetical protein [Xanthomonadales bacterium]